jgi:hypothetical protein
VTALPPEPGRLSFEPPLPSEGPAPAGHRHPAQQAGSLDESARRLSNEELAVAQVLVAEGHQVRSLAPGAGPTADLSVCSRETEIKSLRPGATSSTLDNALRRARRQGTDVIVDARSSGLSVGATQRGVAIFAARVDRGRVERIRVVGDGFDRSYGSQSLDRSRRPGLGRGLG